MTTKHDGSRSSISRTDRDACVDIGFIGTGTSRLFATLSTPLDLWIRSGVLICPPLHADFARNYRNEVLLARELTRAGHAVMRFHYRGQGHSDGDARSMTFGSLKEDALTAVDFLRSQIGTGPLAFIGCRLGGLVAAATAATHGGAPVALWEPVLDPASYVREAVRARAIGSLAGSASDPASTGRLMEQFLRQGWLDIYGYPIYLELFRSLEGRDLRSELGDDVRPILLVQIATSRELTPRYASLVKDLTSLGLPVATHRVTSAAGWWFRGAGKDRERPELLTEETVSTTVEWLSDQVAPAEVRR